MTKKRTTRKKIDDTRQNLYYAVHDLEIDVPVMTTRVVGNRLELSLYGGSIVKWPETAAEKRKRLAAKPKPRQPDPEGEPDEWYTAAEAVLRKEA